MNLKSPGEVFSLLANKISKEQRLAFISTVITGFCCHLFILTNSMYNHDDIRYLYVDFDKPELGRWLQTYAAGISSYYSLPVVNGLLALIYAGIAAMIITGLFKMRSRINIILTSALIVTFPTMACLYSFVFAVDPFLLSCAVSCGAAYVVCRGKGRFSWIAGSALLCISVGIYQAYLPFTLLLMLLFFILRLLGCFFEKEDSVLFIGHNKEYDSLSLKNPLITMGIRYILMLAVGMGGYYLGMEVTLKVKGTELSEYQGIGDSSLPGLKELASRMHTALVDFKGFPFSTSQVLGLNLWLRAGTIVTILVIIVAFIILAAYSGIFKSPLRIALLIVAAVCIPFSINVIWLISDGVNYHILMRHAWCLLFIAALIMSERAVEVLNASKALDVLNSDKALNVLNPDKALDILNSDKALDNLNSNEALDKDTDKGVKGVQGAILGWISFLSTAVVVWNFILISNIGYFNMNFRYEKTYALCLKIVAHLEAYEDYDKDLPLCFVGNYSKTYEMSQLEELLEPMAGMKGKRVFADTSRCYLPFFQNCLGEDIEVVDREWEDAIRDDPRFMEMPRFPNKGSIKTIDDVTVIKLND